MNEAIVWYIILHFIVEFPRKPIIKLITRDNGFIY